MKCQYCYNNIITPFPCRYCSNNFCSLSCLEFHCNSYHINYNNTNNIFLSKQKIINSHFLVKGILNDSIIYDSIYSLKNFIPVYAQDRKIRTIGSGSYGQVYLGFNTITKKYYAIKHMDKNNIIALLHSLSGIQKEIEIQSKTEHPNIVKLLYVKETDISYDLIMDYAPGGNLFHFIRKTKGLNEDLSFNLFIQVVNAINFLHENDLIHRDIKPENILMFENNVVKLCDFGWCVKLNGQQRGTFCGTTEYMSPELVNRRGYGKEIDVWSLGVLLYEMIHGYSPFRPNKPNFDEKEVMENIIHHNLIFQKNISQECKKLIYGLLDPNINNRYTVEDIYNSEFVKKYEQMKFGFQTNNINNMQWVNQNLVHNQSQINNIIYSPQIEMNNNINIHMSMDMNNYVYNIKIPEKKNEYSYKENKGQVRNQSFPKIKKGIYSNYVNSSNIHGNLYSNLFFDNNYYLDNNAENKIMNNNDCNQNNDINAIPIYSNNSLPNNGKLVSNKTWDNFYPINIGKNREQELIDMISSNNNDVFQNDYKRDNKEFINFNNSILYLSGKNDFTLNNVINNNLQLNSINNSGYVKINDSKKQLNNAIDALNDINEKKFQNLSYNNNISNINNNMNYNHYTSVINNYPTLQTSLIKRPPINNYNFDLNTFNNNISILSVPTTSTEIISEVKTINDNINGINNINYINNNINCISKSTILQSVNTRLSKISGFEIEDFNLNLNEKNENDNIKIEINSYNGSLNANNKKNKLINYYHQKLKKEKEPIDNMDGKKKNQNSKEKIIIKGINSSNSNQINNYIKNNSFLLNNKNEEIFKLQSIQLEKKLSFYNEDKTENKKTNKIIEIKKPDIPFYKNINFDQPMELVILKNKELNKNLHLPKSKSFCDKDLLLKMKKKKTNNINRYKNNHTNDKVTNKNLKIIKYLFKSNKDYTNKSYKDLNGINKIKTVNNTENTNVKNKKEEKEKDNSSTAYVSNSVLNIVNTKRENNNDNKINKKTSNQNMININNSMINKSQNSFLSKSHDKKPRNNKKYYKKKELLFPKSPEGKIKFQKINKFRNNGNFIELTPNSESFIKFTDHSNFNNKTATKIGQSYENKKPENYKGKYLKISKTADEKQNSLKNRSNISNLNKNDINKLNKEFLNLSKRENKKLLKPFCSLKNISGKEKIKMNNINSNITKIKFNKKNNVKDTSNDKKNKNKRKLNIKNEISYLKETESIIIQNTSDFNDTNEERNSTPRRESIFNKVKPNKLLENFKKELATNSKRDNILKLKRDSKI